MKDEGLAAVCGLYCGACRMYRAWRDNNQKLLEEIAESMTSRGVSNVDEIKCDGCRAGGRLTPFCQRCEIRVCPQQKTGVTTCADCPDFPCSRITGFNNDGMRHHAEVLENLRRMHEMGIEAWVKAEEERWRCPQCHAPVDWYARTCFKCGATQPYRLPSLPRDKNK